MGGCSSTPTTKPNQVVKHPVVQNNSISNLSQNQIQLINQNIIQQQAYFNNQTNNKFADFPEWEGN